MHTFTRSLSLSSPLPASFQRLFISPTPISLPGKYLQELATIDDYLVNSLLCGEGSQDFPRVCLPYLYLSGRGGREEPKIPCLFLIRPLRSNFVYRWPPWILGAQSFVKRTVKKLNVCNSSFLFNIGLKEFKNRTASVHDLPFVTVCWISGSDWDHLSFAFDFNRGIEERLCLNWRERL